MLSVIEWEFCSSLGVFFASVSGFFALDGSLRYFVFRTILGIRLQIISFLRIFLDRFLSNSFPTHVPSLGPVYIAKVTAILCELSTLYHFAQ